ncbi:MAG: DUF502 domain-containing protein [Alphaproteobacteria bacterium]|nr:DUF502 domain-containing protein [Alphaproteobacteria bacterium]
MIGTPTATPPGAPLPPRKRGLLTRVRNYFLAGVLVTAPVGITAWLIYSFVDYVDTSVIPLIPEAYTPERYLSHSVPGLGVLILLIVITLIGFFVTNFLGRWFVRLGERFLAHVPVVRTIYGLLKQVFDAVLAQSSTAFHEVVLIEYPRKGTWTLGFITSKPKPEIREHLGEDTVFVFVPTSPNPTSGFLLVVHEAELIRLKMHVEEGIKLVISGGIVSSADEVAKKHPKKPHGEPHPTEGGLPPQRLG